MLIETRTPCVLGGPELEASRVAGILSVDTVPRETSDFYLILFLTVGEVRTHGLQYGAGNDK